MKRLLLGLGLLWAVLASAQEREYLWPSTSVMPDYQEHQIAAMLNKAKAPDFVPAENRVAFLEWYDAPEHPNGGCMILISGGSYKNCCDIKPVAQWRKTFTELGFQCVNLVYCTGNGYTPHIEETHHIHKLDAPSGTAKSMASIVAAHLGEMPGIDSIREGEEDIDYLLSLPNPTKPNIASIIVKYGYAENIDVAIKEFLYHKLAAKKLTSEYVIKSLKNEEDK